MCVWVVCSFTGLFWVSIFRQYHHISFFFCCNVRLVYWFFYLFIPMYLLVLFCPLYFRLLSQFYLCFKSNFVFLFESPQVISTPVWISSFTDVVRWDIFQWFIYLFICYLSFFKFWFLRDRNVVFFSRIIFFIISIFFCFLVLTLMVSGVILCFNLWSGFFLSIFFPA